MQVDGEPCLMRPCTIRISMDQGCAKVAKMLARNKNATCKSELVYTGCPITTVLLQMLSEMMRSKIGRPKRSKIASKSTNLKSLEEADYRDRHYPKKTQIHHLRIREKKIFVAFTIEAYFLCSLNRLTIGVGLLLSLIHLFDMLATLHLLCSVPPLYVSHWNTVLNSPNLLGHSVYNFVRMA